MKENCEKKNKNNYQQNYFPLYFTIDQSVPINNAADLVNQMIKVSNRVGVQLFSTAMREKAMFQKEGTLGRELSLTIKF